MKLVEQYGDIYRITDKEYSTMLRNISCDKEYILLDKRIIGYIQARPLDMDAKTAKDLLNDIAVAD